jgi:predicted RNA-binding Zn-ribbon protein involved in translation (DUF1610 family)
MNENTVYEWCPFCCEEIELPNVMGIYECPLCGELITPCAMCDQNNADCSNCIFNRCLTLWRKERE